MGKNSFTVYHEWEHVFRDFEPERVQKLILAMFALSKGEELPELDQVTDAAFRFISQKMRKDKATYLERCKKNRENARLRWDN